MKRLSILILMLAAAATAFADVKIKTQQTMNGQSTESTTYIKGKRSRTEMMGGMMITMTQCDLGRDLQMNPRSKTYMVTYYADGTSSAPQPVKPGEAAPVKKGGTMYITTTIKDTGERKQMFGFTARHIIQTMETESSPDSCNPSKSKMEMDMWVIDAEFGLACTQNRTYQNYNGARTGGCVDKIVPKTIGSAKSGYPLLQKLTSFDANGKEQFSSVSEVVELSKTTLDAALFDVPSDYREVNDAAAMYSASSSSSSSSVSYSSSSASSGSVSYSQPSSGMANSIRNASSSDTSAGDAPLGPKAEGTIRIGIANVKTGAVGAEINASELSAAIQNTLGSYLKGTKIELVPLEAKLASAAAGEAKEKQCDFILNATVSHKKGGGGGFGFGKMLGQVVAQTGIGHTGSVAGNIAGQVATASIVSAASMSGNVKSKDQITLEIGLFSTADNSSRLAKTFNAKARSDGDDIISTVVEQAAQAILDAVK